MKTCVFWTFILCAVLTISPAVAQSLGNAGTVEGVVVDQSGAVIAGAVVSLYNPVALTSRYDNGLVVTGVLDVADATKLTPAQQTTIGFSCDGVFATFANPITTCTGAGKSKLLTLPQTGQENDDHNVNRVRPRHVFNLGIGTDNLLHADGPKRFTASIEIANLVNTAALYNFLSTFSGTHFLQPRTIVGRLGFSF